MNPRRCSTIGVVPSRTIRENAEHQINPGYGSVVHRLLSRLLLFLGEPDLLLHHLHLQLHVLPEFLVGVLVLRDKR